MPSFKSILIILHYYLLPHINWDIETTIKYKRIYELINSNQIIIYISFKQEKCNRITKNKMSKSKSLQRV